MAGRVSGAAIDPRAWRGPFTGWLRRRFLLRLHMTLILVTTFLAGLLATKALLEAELNVLWIRYGLAVVVAYGAFLAAMRVWLWYIGRSARGSRAADLDLPAEAVDAMSSLDLFGGTDVLPAVRGGGRFGGGGATGTWDASSARPLPAVSMPSSDGSDAKGVGSISLDIDDGLGLIVLALLAVVAIAGGYMLWAAPTILAEAAFEAVLAAALFRKARRVDAPGWVGSVLKATALPFLAVLVMSVFAGWYAQHVCPTATRLTEALDCAAAGSRLDR